MSFERQLERTIQQHEFFGLLQKVMRSRAGHELFFINLRASSGLSFWDISSVACFASLWCGFVEKNLHSVYRPLQRVTGGTSHILVTALQRKSSPLVIEKRGPPFIRVVA